jgi:hypothetical protein
MFPSYRTLLKISLLKILPIKKIPSTFNKRRSTNYFLIGEKKVLK